jgi:hypothetical protein
VGADKTCSARYKDISHRFYFTLYLEDQYEMS